MTRHNMNFGKMLEVFMTHNCLHKEPWPKFAAFILTCAFNIKFSNIQKTVPLKWNGILGGMSSLLQVFHLLYTHCIPLCSSRLAFSPDAFYGGVPNWFKCQRVVIYSCSLGSLMLAHQKPWKEKCQALPMTTNIPREVCLNYGHPVCKFIWFYISGNIQKCIFVGCLDEP